MMASVPDMEMDRGCLSICLDVLIGLLVDPRTMIRAMYGAKIPSTT